MSHDIFISYSRRDNDRMGQVRDTLRESGLEVWTDEGIEPGTESWKGSISTAIKGCKAVVVLFSPDATLSTWVNRELDFAELHRKKIYPLLVRGELTESIPFGYTTYQFIDIRDEAVVDGGIQQLTETLHAHISGVPHSTIDSPARPHPTYTHREDENLWKWIDLPDVRLTIPAAWKTHEPTPESIQRLQILMAGKDETLFYRAVEDANRDFVYQITRIPFGRSKTVRLLTDIGEMSPLAGYVVVYTAPYPLRGFLARPVAPLFERRIARFMKLRYRTEVSQYHWTRGAMGRIYSYIFQTSAIIENTEARTAKLYSLYSPLSRRVLFLHLSCQPERFKREEPLFDQVARSLQFVWDA